MHRMTKRNEANEQKKNGNFESDLEKFSFKMNENPQLLDQSTITQANTHMSNGCVEYCTEYAF